MAIQHFNDIEHIKKELRQITSLPTYPVISNSAGASEFIKANDMLVISNATAQEVTVSCEPDDYRRSVCESNNIKNAQVDLLYK